MGTMRRKRHGSTQRSLVGYQSMGCKELDVTEHTAAAALFQEEAPFW